VWCGIDIVFVETIERLNLAKKTKTTKRGIPGRRKKGMKAKKKPAPVPIPPSPPVWKGFGGVRNATPVKKKRKQKSAPKPAPVPPSPLLKILGEDQ
jgi:hypothetical protein